MRAAAEPVASPRPAPKSAPARLTPMKSMGAPAMQTSGTTPWLFIGIASVAVFALVGALLFLLRRKRKGAKHTPAVASGAGLIASVKNRLMPARKPEPEAPMEAEPSAG
jgi:peptidoglycan/LPS O-acetylase OafA/YrhL